jgi:hypothetical protein
MLHIARYNWKTIHNGLVNRSIPRRKRRGKTISCRSKKVPANYAFRFSGPWTALTARRVGCGIGVGLISQLDLRPGIRYVRPATFSTAPHILPLSLHSPARFCLTPRPRWTSTFPCRPLSPQKDTTRLVPKLPQRDYWLLIRSINSTALSR